MVRVLRSCSCSRRTMDSGLWLKLFRYAFYRTIRGEEM